MSADPAQNAQSDRILDHSSAPNKRSSQRQPGLEARRHPVEKCAQSLLQGGDVVANSDEHVAKLPELGFAVPRARSVPRREAAYRTRRHACREIESDPAAFTRRALIYAGAPAGHATLLTAALIEKLLSLKPNG